MERKHYISPVEMDVLAQAARFWQRLAEGRLTAQVVARAAANNPGYRGGESRFTNYNDRETRRFVATVHRIVMPDGSLVHEHLKALVVEGVKYIRP